MHIQTCYERMIHIRQHLNNPDIKIDPSHHVFAPSIALNSINNPSIQQYHTFILYPIGFGFVFSVGFWVILSLPFFPSLIFYVMLFGFILIHFCFSIFVIFGFLYVMFLSLFTTVLTYVVSFDFPFPFQHLLVHSTRIIHINVQIPSHQCERGGMWWNPPSSHLLHYH